MLVPGVGADLFVSVTGTGPPVVLLHGGLGTHDEMAEIAAPVAGSFTAITPDVRGRGRSISRDSGHHTIWQYADDVVAVLDHLGLADAVVGGGSLGSLTALATALRHPARLRALVLLALPMAPGVPLVPAQSRLFEMLLANADTVASYAGKPRSELPPGLERHDPESLAAWMRRDLRELVPVTDLGELAAVTMPAFVVPGVDDLHPPDVARLYADALPAATLREVHDPANATQEMGELTLEFVRSLA